VFKLSEFKESHETFSATAAERSKKAGINLTLQAIRKSICPRGEGQDQGEHAIGKYGEKPSKRLLK
jgi:hypothetical protein